MGPVRNPDRPQGRQNLLEAFTNFKGRNQWILLKVSNEIVQSPRISFRRSIKALQWAMKCRDVSSSS